MIDSEARELLRDPDIPDTVKAALVPEVLKSATSRSAASSSSWRKFLQSGPAIAALASILTLGISETVKVYLKKEEGAQTLTLAGLRQQHEEALAELQREHQRWQEETNQQFVAQTQALNKEHERSLERLKFQFEVIRTALADSKSPQDRADALLFFTEIALLEGLNDTALREWGESEAIPALAAAQTPAQSTPIAVTEPTRVTAEAYKRELGEDVYGPDTSGEEPSNEDLVRVLGCPGGLADFTPPLTPVSVPFEMRIAWNTRQSVARLQIHEAIAPRVKQALDRIVELGVQEHALLFGGTYNPRRVRGGSRWSNHAWGAEIDIDPEGNQLRWREDQFTMHPYVVRAFKEAGFAWRGDRGMDAMSFVISKTALEDIAVSGYEPAMPAGGCRLQ